MIELSHVGLRKAIPPFEPRPAVAAVQELLAETKPEPRVGAQIGDPRHVQPDRIVLSHPQGVAVLEPQRPGHPDTLPGQHGAKRIVASISRHPRHDVLADRPGVLRVQVDLSGQERMPEHLGAAELGSMLGARAGAAHQLGDDLAEHDRFGELLGADADLTRRRAAAGARQPGEQREEQTAAQARHPCAPGRL